MLGPLRTEVSPCSWWFPIGKESFFGKFQLSSWNLASRLPYANSMILQQLPSSNGFLSHPPGHTWQCYWNPFTTCPLQLRCKTPHAKCLSLWPHPLHPANLWPGPLGPHCRLPTAANIPLALCYLSSWSHSLSFSKLCLSAPSPSPKVGVSNLHPASCLHLHWVLQTLFYYYDFLSMWFSYTLACESTRVFFL